ncbi:Clathrin, heavy chain [Parasponia andersonii]|uniref:Clathrin, heavy chain n=1 Tax=Parasponia andersonii TaxID=3476 RepID=A0A2P5AXE0_PARAD|nr:Clathrin, heavy chain [Parasponia andersonii]
MNSPFGAPISPSNTSPTGAHSQPNKERKMASAEQLVLDLSNPDLRENALLELSKVFFFTGPTSDPLVIINSLLKECKSLIRAKLIHQKILILGLAHSVTDLIGAYIACNAPVYAMTLLERLEPSSRSLFWWNAMMRGGVRSGLLHDVLGLYRRMQRLGWRPDHYTFPFVLKACGEISLLRLGASVHAAVCLNGFDENVFVCNAVVTMYGRCGALVDAHKMFEEVCRRGIGDTVSWNSIVAAYSQNGDSKNALRTFERMMEDLSVRPNAFSLVNILPACGSMGLSMWGKEVHGFAVRSGLHEDVFVGNAIVDLYAKCEMMDEANKVFKQMKVKDVVSWNTMVTGYSQVGRFEDAIGLFEKMRMEKIELNVVTWSAVIAGFAQRGLAYEALDVFRQMQGFGSEPNVVTLVSLLSACASAGVLLQGKEKRELFQDLASLLWNSFGTIAALLQEIVSIYPVLSPPNLTPAQSNRVCNALALLQCVASHPDTRMLFLNAHIPLYLYPFLNTTSKSRPFEYLRLTSLGVIGALVKVDETEVISFLLSTEIIPLCLRTMEMGSELSKTVATFIVQKILLDDMGLDYICTTAERFFAVGRVLGNMVGALAEQPSSRLLKHIIRCYLRLSENPRACEALRSCLPDMLRDATFSSCLREDPTTRRWLQQLIHNVTVNRVPGLQPGGAFEHMM